MSEIRRNEGVGNDTIQKENQAATDTRKQAPSEIPEGLVKESGNSPVSNINSEDTTERLSKASRFLSHPSMKSISWEEKESYLQSKGYSNEDIKQAKAMVDNKFDSIFDSPSSGIYRTQHPTQLGNMNTSGQPMNRNTFRNQSYPDQYGMREESEVPGVAVPIAFGGFLAIFGMACFRWLNGDDFVLFPTLENNLTDSRNLQNEIKVEQTCDEECEENNSQAESGSYAESEEESYNDEDILNNPLVGTPEYDVSEKLEALTSAIEKYTSIQEQSLREKKEEKAKSQTDSMMGLLKSKSKKGEEPKTNELNGLNIAVLTQLVEIKCQLSGLNDRYNANEDDNNFKNIVIEKLNDVRTKIESIEKKLFIGGKTETIKDKNGLDQKLEKHEEAEKEEGDCPVDGNISDSTDITQDSKTDEPDLTIEAQTKDENGDTPGEPDLTIEAQTKEENGNTPLEIEDDTECVVKSTPNDDVAIGKVALESALQNMKENNSEESAKVCCQMIYLYISNLANNPSSAKYQKIYTKNNTFKNKVGNVKYARDILVAVGFIENASMLKWEKPSEDDESNQHLLRDALSQIKNLQDSLAT